MAEFKFSCPQCGQNIQCDNGNRSAVHWDMVLIQRPEWGAARCGSTAN